MAVAVQKRLRPAIGYLVTTAPNTSAVSLNAASTYAAFSFVVPSAGKVLSTLRFFLTAVAGTLGVNDLVCALYSDNGGKPGTLIESHALGSAPTGAGWISFGGFTTALTSGGQYWAVLSNANGTPATNYANYLLGSSLLVPWSTGDFGGWGWGYTSSTNAGTTWGSVSSGYAGYRVGYADGTYDGHVAQAVNPGPAVYGTLMEGVRFTSPANAIVNVSGAAFEIRVSSGTPGNLKFALYTGATPTLAAVSNTIPPTDLVGSSAWLQADFLDGQGNPVTVSLQPGTDCHLVFFDANASDPSSKFWQTTEITFDADSCAGGTVNLMPIDGSAKKTFYNGTTWADTANVLMPFALLLDSNGEFASQQTNQPPPAPTLSITDKGDGTGATATIAGGDANATSSVYVTALPAGVGNLSWTQKATIAGNGSGALALTPGYYLAYAEATENALYAQPSNTVVFQTTGPATGLAASGPVALPKSQVRDMIANSSTFQQKTGLLSQAAAYAKIFRTFVRRDSDEEHHSLRPYATILTTPELRYKLDSGGLKNYLLPEGAVGVLLTDLDRYPEDITDSSLDFENFVGGVLVDLEAQAATSGNLSVTELELMAIRRLPEEIERAQGVWWEALIAVKWQA